MPQIGFFNTLGNSRSLRRPVEITPESRPFRQSGKLPRWVTNGNKRPKKSGLHHLHGPGPAADGVAGSLAFAARYHREDHPIDTQNPRLTFDQKSGVDLSPFF